MYNLKNSLQHLFIICQSLAACSVLILGTAAQAESSRTFKQAYQDYQSAVLNQYPIQTARYAQEAYDLAKAKLPKDSPTLSNLSLNLGRALTRVRDPKSVRVLDRTLRQFERRHGKQAPELIDPLMALGNAERMERVKSDGENRYRRALQIAEKHFGADDDLIIQLNMDIGGFILDQGSRDSREYLRNAQRLAEAKYPPLSEQLIKPTFWMGKYHLSNQAYDVAQAHFEAVVKTFDKLDNGTNAPLALTNRAFLVEALEQQGKTREATRHCRIIGAARPWQENKQQEPIYAKAVEYPQAARYRDQAGYVILEYSVNQDGYVADPRIVELEGPEMFSDSVLAAFSEWRFAPRTVAGKAVRTDGLRHRITFEIDYGHVKGGSTLNRFD
ncbi:MAG: energy transducer TonB [Pseudomonadota bacterium]